MREEFRSLSEAVARTKSEVAALSHPDDADRISDVSHRLDAVVNATESATQSILETAETIEANVDKTQLHAAGPEETAAFEAIAGAVTRIFKASNFKDLTGKRITKVLNTLKDMEAGVSHMIEILGGSEAFAATKVTKEDTDDPNAGLFRVSKTTFPRTTLTSCPIEPHASRPRAAILERERERVTSRDRRRARAKAAACAFSYR